MNLDRICCIVGCCINRIHCHNYDKGKAGTYWGVEMIITDFSHNIYSVLLQILDFQNTQAHAGKYRQKHPYRQTPIPIPTVPRHCGPLAVDKKYYSITTNTLTQGCDTHETTNTHTQYNKWEKWHSWPRVAGHQQVNHSLDRPPLHTHLLNPFIKSYLFYLHCD